MSMPNDDCYRLVAAPRFHVPMGFAGRLDRNGGVQFDGVCTYPRSDWHALAPNEVKPAIGDPLSRDDILPPDRLGLVTIPERLRAAWWSEAERSSLEPSAGRFDGHLSKMVDFFSFKRLPMPARVSLVATVSAPGLSSTHIGPEGTPQGLGFGEPTPTLASINLGDETAFVVILELPPAVIARRLDSIGVNEPWALAPSALVRQYFHSFPEQPLLRIRLQPGEGIWFSPFGVVHDGWTDGKSDVDVMLTVRCELSVSAKARLRDPSTVPFDTQADSIQS
jgi:hypothetical protein